jgi:HK97 family phage major capsid protein
MEKKDIEEVVEDLAEAAEADPLVDGLKKVAKFTASQAAKTDKALTDIKAEISGEIHKLDKKLTGYNEAAERGISDVIDRVDLLAKRTSFTARTSFEQDDLEAVKEAIPERFTKKLQAYERETTNSKGLFADARGVAAAHAWFQLSTKLQMRQFDKDRDRNMAEFTKLNDRLEAIEKADMGGLIDTSGGYAVPNIVGNEVLKIIRDASLIYNQARQVTMTSDTLSFPDEATAVTINWSNTDGTTLTAGEPVFGVKTLNARKLIGRATFSLELLDDANVAIIPFLQSCFAEKMGGELDLQAIEGSGAPFTGVSGATSVNDAVVTTNGTIGQTLTYSSVTATFASLTRIYTAASEQSSIKGGTFVCGPAVYAKIIGLVDGNGQPVVRLGTVEGQPNQTLFGRPIIVSARLPKVTLGAGTNSVGGLYYGPMSTLLFGTRQGMRWDVTDQVNWAKYQADARMVGRFGFVVGVPTAWVRNLGIAV